MRNTIKNLLDLDDMPTWSDLGDGLACALSLVITCGILFCFSAAMGMHQ